MGCPVKKIILLVLALCCLSDLFLVTSSYAVIYKYTDKDGTVSFADDLQGVPEKYRATAVIVEGESKEEGAKQSASAPAVKPEQPSAVETLPIPRTQAPRPLSYRLMMSAAFILCSGVIFIFMSKQAELKNDKKILSFIRTAFIAVVSLYLVVAHIKDVLIVFGFAGKTISDVQQQSAEKGKKAAQTMKNIDVLFEQAQRAQQAEESKARESAGEKGQ